MRQDKDRTGKWLITHHGDALLRLAGITGFSAWRALQPETVAPRRLADGLLEVQFPGEVEPMWVLVEIEAYPDSDMDRQVFDDLMLIAVDRKIVPEVISLILKPKGNLTVAGSVERTSPRGRTRLSGSWPVVRLWELDADTLLNEGDAGLIPLVPLTRTNLTPDELMTRCRDRIAQVSDPTDRTGLSVVTQILAGFAFPTRQFLNLFGGAMMMIDSPVLDEVKEILRKRYLAEGAATGRIETLREGVYLSLETRFGPLPEARFMMLNILMNEDRLRALHRLAITCPDLDSFVAALNAEPSPGA
jgi:hypothetical protein